jgi:hypothetical protein
MADLDTLKSLRERVIAAEGPDRRLDAELCCAFHLTNLRPAEPDDFEGKYGYSPGNLKCEHGFLMAEFYTSSIDAALGLVERVLPGVHWDRFTEGDVHLYWRPNIEADYLMARSPRGLKTPLAILAALLSALISKEPSDG